MNRPCTLCSDRGKTTMCAQCRAEARAFYREAPSITGVALVTVVALLLTGWFAGEVATGVHNARSIDIEATP